VLINRLSRIYFEESELASVFLLTREGLEWIGRNINIYIFNGEKFIKMSSGGTEKNKGSPQTASFTLMPRIRICQTEQLPNLFELRPSIRLHPFNILQSRVLVSRRTFYE
jgi:hypothetical protein